MELLILKYRLHQLKSNHPIVPAKKPTGIFELRHSELMPCLILSCTSCGFKLNEIVQTTSNIWTNDSAQVFIQDDWRCMGFLGPGWLNQRIGFWIDTLSNYAALKINVAGKTYYGWVKLEKGDTSFAVQEYACNLKADQLILAGQATSSYITTSPIAQTSLCAGNILQVGFTAYGSFNSQNVFTAEISDSLGSFNNPVSIGSYTSGTSGFIPAKIPGGTVFSTMYRVRVKSSKPSLTAVDNGGDLRIYPGLPAATIISYGGTVACGEIDLYAPYGDGYTYQWKKNNINITDANSLVFYANTTGNYSCVISNSCGSITSNVLSITVLPFPNAAITATGPTSFCSGGMVTLNANTGSGLSYQWYNYDYGSGNYVPVTGAISSTFIAKVTGAYEVLVKNTSGCGFFSNAIAVYVITENPKISISPAKDQTLCNGDSWELSANINNYTDGANYQYQWMRNGVNIPGETIYYYYPSTTGTYKCKVTDVCGSTTSKGVKITIKQCTGLLHTAIENDEKIISTTNQLKVAPNPFSNATTISFFLPQSQKISISIFDITGRLMKTIANEEMQQGNHEIKWNVNDEHGNRVSSGIYFLKDGRRGLFRDKKAFGIK